MAGHQITAGKQYGKDGYVCLQRKDSLRPSLGCVAQDTMMAGPRILGWPVLGTFTAGQEAGNSD